MVLCKNMITSRIGDIHDTKTFLVWFAGHLRVFQCTQTPNGTMRDTEKLYNLLDWMKDMETFSLQFGDIISRKDTLQ